MSFTSLCRLGFHSYNLSILLRAITNGTFFFLSKLIDSMVWGSRQCIISTTRIAISQRDDPRSEKQIKKMARETLFEMCAHHSNHSCNSIMIFNKGMTLLPIGTQGNINYWPRRFEKDSWPGVSIISKPGNFTFSLSYPLTILHCSWTTSIGTFVAPI